MKDKMDDLFKSIVLHIMYDLQNCKYGFGKTRVIKLAYLVELEYYRRNQQRLTSIEWIYYKYGPYVMDFDSILSDKNIEIGDDDSDFKSLRVIDETSLPTIPKENKLIISHIVKRYGADDLQNLLDYVYFDTEPMMCVEKRGEILDFSTTHHIDYYRVHDYSIKASDKQKLLNEFQEKKKNARTI
jgi:hypothetical protein